MNKLAIALLAGVASFGFASTAFAADLMVDTPMASPGVVDVSGSWEGPYVGVFGGWAMGTADQTGPTPPSGPYPTDGVDIDLSGGILGLTAGANFAVADKVLLGIAGDIAWTNLGGEYDGTGITNGPFYSGTTHDINWTGAVRGVLGFDGGSIMPYLTAGVAFANATRDSRGLGTLTADATHIGWTAGVGVSVAVADKISLNLQYLHSDYGTQTYEWDQPNNYDQPEVGMTTDAVTVGLNFGF